VLAGDAVLAAAGAFAVAVALATGAGLAIGLAAGAAKLGRRLDEASACRSLDVRGLDIVIGQSSFFRPSENTPSVICEKYRAVGTPAGIALVTSYDEHQ